MTHHAHYLSSREPPHNRSGHADYRPRAPQVKGLVPYLQSIERITLIPLAMFRHQFWVSQTHPAMAQVALNRVVDIAPEVPVQVDAAAISPREQRRVAGRREHLGHLSRIDAPHLKHAGILRQDV